MTVNWMWASSDDGHWVPTISSLQGAELRSILSQHVLISSSFNLVSRKIFNPKLLGKHHWVEKKTGAACVCVAVVKCLSCQQVNKHWLCVPTRAEDTCQLVIRRDGECLSAQCVRCDLGSVRLWVTHWKIDFFFFNLFSVITSFLMTWCCHPGKSWLQSSC